MPDAGFFALVYVVDALSSGSWQTLPLSFAAISFVALVGISSVALYRGGYPRAGALVAIGGGFCGLSSIWLSGNAQVQPVIFWFGTLFCTAALFEWSFARVFFIAGLALICGQFVWALGLPTWSPFSRHEEGLLRFRLDILLSTVFLWVSISVFKRIFWITSKETEELVSREKLNLLNARVAVVGRLLFHEARHSIASMRHNVQEFERLASVPSDVASQIRVQELDAAVRSVEALAGQITSYLEIFGSEEKGYKGGNLFELMEACQKHLGPMLQITEVCRREIASQSEDVRVSSVAKILRVLRLLEACLVRSKTCREGDVIRPVSPYQVDVSLVEGHVHFNLFMASEHSVEMSPVERNLLTVAASEVGGDFEVSERQAGELEAVRLRFRLLMKRAVGHTFADRDDHVDHVEQGSGTADSRKVS